jgi:hypothetical protein
MAQFDLKATLASYHSLRSEMRTREEDLTKLLLLAAEISPGSAR